MATEMTLTRVLARLSVLKKQIGKEIDNNLLICAVTKGTGDRKRVISMPDASVSSVELKIRSSTDAIQGLLLEQSKLKRALNLTNSTTYVKIGDMQMTISDAIDYKTFITMHKLPLLRRAKEQLATAIRHIDVENERLNDEIERAVQIAYSNEKGKVENSQYELVANPRKKEHEAQLLDPIGVRNFIDQLEKEIEFFLGEVDFVLSEVNAKTTIQID